MKLTLLIVEDDEGLRPTLKRAFACAGHQVHEAAGVAAAGRLLREQSIDVMLLDIHLRDGSGLDVLAAARELDAEIVVIMMTAYPEVKTAVRAMKEGAADFIIKPFELDELDLAVERAVQSRELRRQVRRFELERARRDDITEILGESDAVEQLRNHIRRVAPVSSSVLVVGETGTGKELVADSVHRLSPRAANPLVKVNCSAFSEQLLESELFGHEKGAFTDAKEARTGLFELAGGGTLFLDEISEMRPGLQAKLLRVVEGQPFRRVGGRREICSDVRIVAATNRDLPARIRTGDFREDLYFRLKGFQITMPPLRVRGRDAILLARFFLQRAASAMGKGELRLTSEAEEMLLAYDWPGNIRELRNVMERAAILCDGGEIGVPHLPGELQTATFVGRFTASGSEAMPPLADIERQYITRVVASVDGNLSQAARILGLNRGTLRIKLRLSEDSTGDN